MDDLRLGRFGDRRLEKGGRFCWSALLRLPAREYGCASLAVIGLEKSA
jgi:hypothetical protein